MGLGRIAHLLAPTPASPPRGSAAPAPAQRSLSAVGARLAAPPAVAAAPRPLSAALARLATPAAPPVAEEQFAYLGTVGGHMVWPDVGTRVRWSEETHQRHGKIVRHGTREYTGTITRLTLDEMEPRDIDVWVRPDGGGRERRVFGIGGLRVPKADLPAFVARAEQWFQKRMEALYGAWPPPPRPAPPPAQAEKRQIANFLIRRAATFASVWPRPGQTVAATDAEIANVLREEGVAIERAPEVPGQTALEARRVAVRHLQNAAAATKGKPREALFIAANHIEGGMHLGLDEEPAASAPDPRRPPEGLEQPGPARVERAPEATPLSIASARERASIVAYLKREADGARRGRAQIAAEQLRAIAAEVSTMTMPAADLRAAVIDLLITHALLKTADGLRQSKHFPSERDASPREGEPRVELPESPPAPASPRPVPAPASTRTTDAERSARQAYAGFSRLEVQQSPEDVREWAAKLGFDILKENDLSGVHIFTIRAPNGLIAHVAPTSTGYTIRTIGTYTPEQTVDYGHRNGWDVAKFVAAAASPASARERASIVAYLKREADGAQRGRAHIAAEKLRAIAAEVSTMTMPAADLRAAVIDLLITHALHRTAESLREQMGPTMARVETEARTAVGVEPAGAPRPPEPPPAEAEAATPTSEQADSPAPSGARSEPAERRPAKPPPGLNPCEADVLRIAEVEEGKGQRRVAADLRKAIARRGGVPDDQAYRDLLNRVTEMRAEHVAMAAESVGDRWEMPPPPTLTAVVGFRAKADRARRLSGGHETASLFGFLAGRAEEGEEVPAETLERAEQLLTQAETSDAEARERLLGFLHETRTRALALSAADGKSTAAVLARLTRRIERERSPAAERTDLLRKASDTLSADMGMRRLFTIERGGRVDLMEQYGRWMNRQAEPNAEPTAAPATPPAPPPRPPFDFSIVLATAKDARGPQATLLHLGGTPRNLDDAWRAARFRPGERVLTYPSALYHIATQGTDGLLDQARRDVVELEETAATENRERGPAATAGSEAWWQAKMTERGLHALAEARTTREALSSQRAHPGAVMPRGGGAAARASRIAWEASRYADNLRDPLIDAREQQLEARDAHLEAARLARLGALPAEAERHEEAARRHEANAATEAERKAGESRARILSILAEGPASERALLAALADPTAAHLLSDLVQEEVIVAMPIGAGSTGYFLSSKPLIPEAPPSTLWDVVLVDVGPDREAVIEAVRAFKGGGRKEAVDFIEGSLPATVRFAKRATEAENDWKTLAAAGATVRVRRSPIQMSSSGAEPAGSPPAPATPAAPHAGAPPSTRRPPPESADLRARILRALAEHDAQNPMEESGLTYEALAEQLGAGVEPVREQLLWLMRSGGVVKDEGRYIAVRTESEQAQPGLVGLQARAYGPGERAAIQAEGIRLERLARMQSMLHGAGYDPAAAEALQAGGMDPEDLRRRLLVPPGEPGSLAITHGLSPETSAKGSPAAAPSETDADAARFHAVLVQEAGPGDSEAERERLKALANSVADAVRRAVRTIDFWRNSTEQNVLRSVIFNLLDAANVVPFEEQDAVVDRLMRVADPRTPSVADKPAVQAPAAAPAPSPVDLSVAEEILRQLGGQGFLKMTGARRPAGDARSLKIKLPARFAKDGINLVHVTLDPTDTYTVRFGALGPAPLHRYREVAVVGDVHGEDLQRVFTEHTGLDTRLPVVLRGPRPAGESTPPSGPAPPASREPPAVTDAEERQLVERLTTDTQRDPAVVQWCYANTFYDFRPLIERRLVDLALTHAGDPLMVRFVEDQALRQRVMRRVALDVCTKVRWDAVPIPPIPPEQQLTFSPQSWALFQVFLALAPAGTDHERADAARSMENHLREQGLLTPHWSETRSGRMRVEQSMLAESWNRRYAPLGFDAEEADPPFLKRAVAALASTDTAVRFAMPKATAHRIGFRIPESWTDGLDAEPFVVAALGGRDAAAGYSISPPSSGEELDNSRATLKKIPNSGVTEIQLAREPAGLGPVKPAESATPARKGRAKAPPSQPLVLAVLGDGTTVLGTPVGPNMPPVARVYKSEALARARADELGEGWTVLTRSRRVYVARSPAKAMGGPPESGPISTRRAPAEGDFEALLAAYLDAPSLAGWQRIYSRLIPGAGRTLWQAWIAVDGAAPTRLPAGDATFVSFPDAFTTRRAVKAAREGRVPVGLGALSRANATAPRLPAATATPADPEGAPKRPSWEARMVAAFVRGGIPEYGAMGFFKEIPVIVGDTRADPSKVAQAIARGKPDWIHDDSKTAEVLREVANTLRGNTQLASTIIATARRFAALKEGERYEPLAEEPTSSQPARPSASASREQILAYLDQHGPAGAPLGVITREVAGPGAYSQAHAHVIDLLREMKEEGIVDMRVEDDRRWYTRRPAVPSPMFAALARLLGDEPRAREAEARIENAAQPGWWENLFKTRRIYSAALRIARDDEALADQLLDVARRFESQVLAERPLTFVSRKAGEAPIRADDLQAVDVTTPERPGEANAAAPAVSDAPGRGRKTGRAVRLYSGGIASLVEAAVREDGVVCERFQNKTRFHYQWTPWRVTALRLDLEHLPDTIEIGFSTLRVVHGPKVEGLRLPL